eukprot:651700-Amphidinium_carterae.3
MGMKYNRIAGGKADVVPVQEAVDLQSYLLEKVVWTMDHIGVGGDQIGWTVVNIIEIALKIAQQCLCFFLPVEAFDSKVM